MRKKGISHPAVNSAFRIEGRKYLVDAIFRSMAELHQFIDEFRPKAVHHVIEEISSERFLTRDEHLGMI